jgi:hypothetical protein
MSSTVINSEKLKVDVKKFYEGKKTYFRQKFSLTLVILEHHPKIGTTSTIEPFVEIIAFDEIEGLEAPHLFLSYDLLVAKLGEQPLVENTKPKTFFRPSLDKDPSLVFKPSLEKDSPLTDGPGQKFLLQKDGAKKDVPAQFTRMQSSRLVLKAGSLHLQDLMIKFVFDRVIVSNNKIPNAAGFTIEL